MKKIIVTGLCFVGMVATILLGFYLLGMLSYAIQDDAWMPDIAYLPKSVFLLVPLVFLGITKDAKHGLEWIGRRLFRLVS